MTRVVTLGETMALARTTEIGSLRHAAGLALGIGGAESNVAVGLRRMGVDVSWLGRVGDDPLGERIARELRAEGLDVRAIVDGGAPTGLMLKERPSAASTAGLAPCTTLHTPAGMPAPRAGGARSGSPWWSAPRRTRPSGCWTDPTPWPGGPA